MALDLRNKRRMNQRKVWDAIAQPWHHFRRRAPPEVKEFLGNKKGMILDLGCGSGRNFIDGKKYVGVDFSENMLRYAMHHAKKNNADAMLVKADIAKLPFKRETFDTVLLVAALHVTKRHGEVLKEMKYVMRRGGSALLTVWNKSQPKFFFSAKESYMQWKFGDGETHHRYYYLFTEEELRKLLPKYFVVERIWGGRYKALGLFPKNIIAIVIKT